MHPASPSLFDLGWDAGWAATLAEGPASLPGRVSRIDRGISTVLTADGPVRVADVIGMRLAVGDWVTLAQGSPTTDKLVLSGILPRRRVLQRATDGNGGHTQVVAANIDTVLLAVAMDGYLSVRHLQRYVALAWQSDALPLIVITKADLAPPCDVRMRLEAMEEAAAGVAVHVLSAATGQGLGTLAGLFPPCKTVALVGLSGAGKSTLVNALAGNRDLTTGTVRADGKGRHTTTHRELVALPGGGLVIDTPGMRALSVSAAADGVAQVFADVEDLERRCSLPSCSHTTEATCAVAAAVAAGVLSASRVSDWRRLQLEAALHDRQVARLRIADRKRRKLAAKAMRREGRAPE